MINFALTEKLEFLLNASKQVICRSGYSSVMDLITLGKSAILIPTKNQNEQEYLAQYLNKKGYFSMISEDCIATQRFEVFDGLKAEIENKEFDKIWGKLEKDERGYILFAENTKTKTTSNGGSDDAMEFLRDEGVDTIYWFADFQDGILSEPLDELVKSMKRGRITLIMHDFVAPLGRKNKDTGKTDPKTLKMLQRLADETDGKFFLKEL